MVFLARGEGLHDAKMIQLFEKGGDGFAFHAAALYEDFSGGGLPLEGHFLYDFALGGGQAVEAFLIEGRGLIHHFAQIIKAIEFRIMEQHLNEILQSTGQSVGQDADGFDSPPVTQGIVTEFGQGHFFGPMVEQAVDFVKGQSGQAVPPEKIVKRLVVLPIMLAHAGAAADELEVLIVKQGLAQEVGIVVKVFEDAVEVVQEQYRALLVGLQEAVYLTVKIAGVGLIVLKSVKIG